MNTWGSTNNAAMYIKRLQIKQAVKEFWLLWSTSHIDPDKSHDATQSALSQIGFSNLQFTFVRNAIRTNDYTKKEPPS